MDEDSGVFEKELADKPTVLTASDTQELDDTIAFFDVILSGKLTDDERAALVARMRCAQVPQRSWR